MKWMGWMCRGLEVAPVSVLVPEFAGFPVGQVVRSSLCCQWRRGAGRDNGETFDVQIEMVEHLQ